MYKQTLLALFLAGAGLAPAMADADVPVYALNIPTIVFKGQAVTGHPYSATQTMHTYRALADGNVITTETVQRLYRDGAGRVRKENLNGSGEIVHIELTDAQGELYVLDPARKTAVKPAVMALTMKYSPQEVKITASGADVPPEMLDKFNTTYAAAQKTASNLTTRDLGTRDIEGCKATGSASRNTVMADVEGNRNPIDVAGENWFCAELGMMLYTKHDDPRFGQTTTVISRVDRGEPDAALFVIPADYSVLAQTSQAAR